MDELYECFFVFRASIDRRHWLRIRLFTSHCERDPAESRAQGDHCKLRQVVDMIRRLIHSMKTREREGVIAWDRGKRLTTWEPT